MVPTASNTGRTKHSKRVAHPNRRVGMDIFHKSRQVDITTELQNISLDNGSDTPSTSMILPRAAIIVNGLGPVSLVGGTAVIYSSLLQHPSSTLTELSLFLMALLALQYAFQPRLSKRYISPKVNKQSVALIEEVVKTGMAASIFVMKPRHLIDQALNDWSISSSLAVAGLPAVLYALQGVLQYVSHQNLDPVTFNGLTQTKTLSAALCCWIIMRTPQSPLQIVALTILFGSALVFQGYFFGGKNKSDTLDGTSKSAKLNGIETHPSTKQPRISVNEAWIWRGVIPCLAAAFLSGLAGALSQKGLQRTGIAGRDPFLYTVEISFYSAITLLISMARSSTNIRMDLAKQRSQWTYTTLIPIVVKAAGGVITALVHKYAGSVAKGFALMFGLVLSGTIQMCLAQESLQPHQVTGTLMIMLATWMHFTHP